jgi:predicted aspartyl protease
MIFVALGLAVALNAAPAAVPATDPAPVNGPTIPTATLDDSLEITGDELPAELAGRMYIDARVNGAGPFRFLVDSGADRSAVGARLAARLHLPVEATVRLVGMAGTSEVGTVLVERLTLGNSTLDQLVVPALSERHLGAAGLIGIDALADQRLLLDFEASTVTVQDSRQPAPLISADEIVVTARRRKGQLIITRASAMGIPIAAVIDTGSDITIGNSALRRRLLGGRRAERQVTLISVTGQTVIADVALVPEVRIGGVAMRNVPIAFADAPPFSRFGLERQPAVFLGTDLLRNFRRLALDFRHRRVRFVLRK